MDVSLSRDRRLLTSTARSGDVTIWQCSKKEKLFNHKKVYPIRVFANIPILVFVFTIAGTQWDALFSPFIFFYNKYVSY